MVVGLGRMGRFHHKVLRDLGYDVTTVDPNVAGADYATAPRRQFDVTCVATPIGQLASAAADRIPFTRCLFIEKPLAASAAQARELAERIPPDKPTAVGYVERFNPQVRALKSAEVSEAHFVRWNLRPTANVALDLRSHDIDLARWLGIGQVTYDSRGGAPSMKREVITEKGVFDLCAHDTSPLHAQWHRFLSVRYGPATVADAIAVLDELQRSNVTSADDLAVAA